ncbi:MAG: ATP-dependent RNA helicase HrpA [Sphingobacteriia bacterium]|nr:ATP-dependent RNA helicase HrpA [Sphingobacteriia bacterium]NCC38832.1 ATP-dependent RNA helicase HrpA [Gammaproteobacteria bacterium]
MSEPRFPTDTDLAACLIQDRERLRGRARALSRRARAGQPFERGLVALWAAVHDSQARVAERLALVPGHIEYPPELPVSERREEVADSIRAHQVLVLCGETGSGKSTQLPKICLELGRGVQGRIGHTQPRRIAARSLASRIARELGGTVGALVGDKVRFHDRVRPETAIKLMTDGILLAEIQQDRLLREYDTLIIDEAHERSLNIDFLLGYLKKLLPRRPDLKLIITSATIDPRRFAVHFADARGRHAPILEISGRTYPVEVHYRPPAEESAGERDESMQQAISEAVEELSRAGRGDVLVFLSGEREIRETAETLRRHHPPGTEILPLYARQGPREQARIFAPHGARRVVLATNVAETSLTVPGIHYVVDPGFARISRYSHRRQLQRLPVERISQASAEQRKGRCGRVAAGICIRLYTPDNLSARAPYTEPEIQRTNLAAVILRMKLLGFGAVATFPFIDPPDPRLVADGMRTLEELAALDAAGELTALGRQLARLPVDPRIGRMLLAATELRCLAEMLVIAAALSVQDPRERPLEQRGAADQIHATFAHPDSDFLTFLNLWRFLEQERKARSRNQFRLLCERHFLSFTRVQEWHDIYTQLREQLLEMGFKENQSAGTDEEIHRALLSGLLGHIGALESNHEYLGARQARFRIHPSSGLFKTPPKWILAAERVETTRAYGRIVARVQPGWIEAAGQHLLQRRYFEPHWQAKSGQVAAYEKVSLFGVTLVPKRRVNYGPINPAESREIFIRFALVEGDFNTRAPFWRHNQELIESIHRLEAKSRRRDILVDEEAIYSFYAARIPSGIYATPQFEQWLRAATRQDPKILHLRPADLMRHAAPGITPERFPDRLQVGATALPLQYRLAPGEDDDGLTLVVPLPLINQVTPERLDWLVPGLLEARITALLRGLPKAIRTALVPVPDTAARLAAVLEPSERPLTRAIAEQLAVTQGVHIPEDAWDLQSVPAHLRMKVRLVDEQGRALALDEDPLRLRRRFGQAGQVRFAQIPDQALERTGITRWDFGDLPEQVELERAGIRLLGFPALVEEGDNLAIRVLDSSARAAQAHRAGLRRLILLELGQRLRPIRQSLRNLDRLRLLYAKAPTEEPVHSAPLGVGASRPQERHPDPGPAATAPLAPQPPDLADELMTLILDHAFLDERPTPPRTQADFTDCLAAGQPRLQETLTEVSKLTGEILTAYHELRQRLAATTQINWQPMVTDLRIQLDGLVFRGCFQSIPYARLKQYPRYLKAATQRLERLTHAAARDRERMAAMADLLGRWRERTAAARAAGREDPRLDEIRWLIEELRVSFFAQALGTAEPVSIKRIETRWRELGL